jgi:hypothetical protein
MTYARARLSLGIINIVFWVLVSIVGLITGLPGQLFSTPETTATEIAQRLITLLALYNLCCLPFEVFGGFMLPRRYGKPTPAFAEFLLSWLRGALVQFVVMFLTGMLIIIAGTQSRTIGVVIFVAGVVMAAMLWGQEWLARLGASLRSTPLVNVEEVRKHLEKWGMQLPESFVVRSSRDPSFVGALAGLPGLERFVLPEVWFSTLTPEGAAAQIARRIGVVQTESRSRGVFLAVIWNLVGFWLAMSLTGTGAINSVRGLFTVSLWFTLWSAVGLVVLPTFSRPGVYEADRFAKKEGASQEILESSIRELDKLQDDEPTRSNWEEWIFHPTPSADNRIGELSRKRARGPFGAWHASSMALYLSWACLGLLARAEHAIIGRPALWVMYPGD